MNRRKKIEVNTNEVPQKDVFKCVVSLIFIFIHNFYINVKYSIHIVTDFIFKRYSWYRKSRGTFSVRIMTKSHGDARNHAYNGWRIYKGDLEDNYGFRVYLAELQKKYYILEVWGMKEKIDIVKKFKIDENKLKRYIREDKIESILR